MKRVAVVTTFSAAGWSEYAKRMVTSFDKYWPREVNLHVYPDDPSTPLPPSDRIFKHDNDLSAKDRFLRRYTAPRFSGRVGEGYNYRFDVRKFCHKPFAVHDFAHFKDCGGYDWMIWLDADTITHHPVTRSHIDRMTPDNVDVLYLGRQDKYSECGFYALRLPHALPFVDQFIDFYTKGSFKNEAEWHDSFLFDRAMDRVKADEASEVQFWSLTNFPRRKGGGHPFINSFLGEIMDHHKGNRKRAGRPRSGDLHVEHTADYWREQNAHARKRQPSKPKA